MVKENKFSAAESSLGYLYQIRYALFVLLESKQGRVFLETLDDVVLELHRVTTLYQLKHILKSAASLTDASPQLWTIYPSEDP
jgi:hypothetical protein